MAWISRIVFFLFFFLPLVLPLMMPSRHRIEKENILFPPADRLPFLRESVWGKAKESCLGVRRPFPNTTLADMFIFWSVTREKMDSVLSMTLSASLRHRSPCPSCCYQCPPRELPVLSGESSNPETGDGLKAKKGGKDSDPPMCLCFIPTTVGKSLPHPNSHKLSG